MNEEQMPRPYTIKRGHEGYQLHDRDGHMVYDSMKMGGATELLKVMNAHDPLVAALRDLVQISEIAVGFGVMREDANGPLPTAQKLLASLGVNA